MNHNRNQVYKQDIYLKEEIFSQYYSAEMYSFH